MNFFEEEPITTKNNHLISQFFQKQFGINYYEYNNYKPVYYNKNKDKIFVPSGKGWNIDKQYQCYKIFTQNTEKSFNDNEIDMSNLYTKGIFKKLLDNQKDLFVSFYDELTFQNTQINDYVNDNDMEKFSEFYKSIFERYTLSLAFTNNDTAKEVIEKTIQNRFEIFREDIEKEFSNNINKAKRILIQEGRKYAKVFSLFKENLLSSFKNSEITILYCNKPIFPLTEMPFLTECNYEKNKIQIFICPINSYSIFINKEWLDKFDNYTHFFETYKNSITINNKSFTFSSLENKNNYFNFDFKNILYKDFLLAKKILNNIDFEYNITDTTIEFERNPIKSWWTVAKENELICWEGAKILNNYEIYVKKNKDKVIFYTIFEEKIKILLIEEDFNLIDEIESFFNELKKEYINKD